MGILQKMIEAIQRGKPFKEAVKLCATCEDKNCLSGKINIFKAKEPDIYTISIDCSEIFPSKEKLYEYYFTLYEAFEKHFKQVTELRDIHCHVCTYKGERVNLIKSGKYYGIDQALKFTGTMADCKDWFYGTLKSLFEECFN